ncbi:MAG: MFS transporter [Deltaproteobacteria bacterium]
MRVTTSSTWPKNLSVLQERSYCYLLAGQSVSFMGDAMANVALAFATLALGGSTTALGIVFTAKSVALVGCLLAGGALADRFPRRTILVSMDCVRVLSQGAIAALLLTGTPSVWSIAVLSTLTGAATGFFQPASPGLLTSMVKPELLQSANALGSLGYSLGRMSGPIIAGLLVARFGAGWALAADAASFAASAALLSRIRRPSTAVFQSRSLIVDLQDGWQAFHSRKWLWTFVTWLSFSSLLYGCFTIVGPVVAARDLGGAPAWGFIISAQGVGGILGGVIALHIDPRRPLFFAAIALAGFYLPLALFALRMPLEIIAAGALMSEVGLMLSSTTWDSAVQRHIEPALLSRISAYRRLGPSALAPMGLALWGPVAAVMSLDKALWLAFVLQIIGVVVLLAVREVRHLPAHPAESEPTVR